MLLRARTWLLRTQNNDNILNFILNEARAFENFDKRPTPIAIIRKSIAQCDGPPDSEIIQRPLGGFRQVILSDDQLII